MKEEMYGWMECLAVFYILFTTVLHLVPTGKYERYVRFFMGLLLILMMCTPVFSLFGKSGELGESFREFYAAENNTLKQEELESLQKMYLQKGYTYEIEARILEVLETAGARAVKAEAKMEGESVKAVIYLTEMPDAEGERRIADGLERDCGLKKGDYQIEICGYDETAVAGASSFGTSAGSGSSSRVQ